MLDNALLCKSLASILLLFGGYLAIFNTVISAWIIGERSGLTFAVGFAIACGLTVAELWFAGWGRNLSNWRLVVKDFRREPEKTALKLFSIGFGLFMIYHYDILSTWLSVKPKSTDFYFFIWGVAWLVFGPEVILTLSNWLFMQAKKAETQQKKANNERDAELMRLRTERTTMMGLAEEVGKEGAIAKMTRRYNLNH